MWSVPVSSFYDLLAWNWGMDKRRNHKKIFDMKSLFRLSTFLLGIPLLLVYINSCVSSTVVTGTWETPTLEKTYDDIMVAAMVPAVSTRSSIEMKIVKHLEEKDVEASQSIDAL